MWFLVNYKLMKIHHSLNDDHNLCSTKTKITQIRDILLMNENN